MTILEFKMSRISNTVWSLHYRCQSRAYATNDRHSSQKWKENNTQRNEKWWSFEIERRNIESHIKLRVKIKTTRKINRLIYTWQNNWWRNFWQSQDWNSYYHSRKGSCKNLGEKQNCWRSRLWKSFKRNSHFENSSAPSSGATLWNYRDA